MYLYLCFFSFFRVVVQAKYCGPAKKSTLLLNLPPLAAARSVALDPGRHGSPPSRQIQQFGLDSRQMSNEENILGV